MRPGRCSGFRFAASNGIPRRSRGPCRRSVPVNRLQPLQFRWPDDGLGLLEGLLIDGLPGAGLTLPAQGQNERAYHKPLLRGSLGWIALAGTRQLLLETMVSHVRPLVDSGVLRSDHLIL